MYLYSNFQRPHVRNACGLSTQPRTACAGPLIDRRLLRVQSLQLPTKSQVLEDEVLSGTDAADQPTEEMTWQKLDSDFSVRILAMVVSLRHSFCRCTTLWRGTAVVVPGAFAVRKERRKAGVRSRNANYLDSV
jgi:hypothetical protein